MDSTPTPVFEKARHTKYHLRCLKTLLPHHYTPNDSNRLYLAFFTLSALDLLSALHTSTTESERQGYIDWIYSCQHPGGGFRMGPSMDLGGGRWDPGHLPATYFALASLLVLGDDLGRVRRGRCLRWLRGLQRGDGSFGETVVGGVVEGGRDPRFAHCAAGVRYFLRGTREGGVEVEGEVVEDIDVEGLVACLRRAESFDGGIADEPSHEPHAGYTFCTLGALRFLNRLSTTPTPQSTPALAPSNPDAVTSWLVNLQTPSLPPDPATAKLSPLDLPSLTTPPAAGFSGRPNKPTDTCYAFWAPASLHLLHRAHLYDHEATVSYLLTQTQNPVTGGFGKFPGDPPDLYHSYLGLAALSLAGEKGVKEVDAGMCVSVDARGRLKEIWEGWGIEG